MELVDNLLDSSRLQNGSLDIDIRPVDLAAVIGENVERLRVRFPMLDIRWAPPSEDSTVEADARRLGQVLENLASNVAKYAPGGPLSIELDMSEDEARLTFKDGGPGIPAQHREQVFERFYRLPASKELARGSGLGLYICKQIVLAHGGEIGLAKTKGKGAEFIIRLPRRARVPLAVNNEG